MTDIADRYISAGGRPANYDRDALVSDLADLSAFLAWAAEDDAIYGAVRANDAFLAACRLLDVDAAKLRAIAAGS
jgi:hypothetical protein